MELVTQTSEWLEHEFFQGLRRLDAVSRWAPWAADDEAADDRKALGRRVERLAAELVADRGWPVCLTGDQRHWDLWAGGAKVEVKAARWYPAPSGGGRYQVMIRNGQADLFLVACVGDDEQVWAWFVIPARAVGARRNIAVTSPDPRAYQGRWARYLERWELVDEAAEAAGPFPGQLSLELNYG